MNDTSEPALSCSERATRDGRRIGLAALNRPRTLNGLSLQMARQLDAQLQHWAQDEGVVLVVLQGAGEKAFCAGGDLHALYAGMQAARSGEVDGGILANACASEFFEVEYRLDYRIHCYAKPLLCWGHGLVMGGGIGLMAGASHRVVSEHSKLAFPEITVGLFPDVGGSWLLNRVPGHGGRFLALTGAGLNAGDSMYARLADFHLPEARRAEVLDALSAPAWSTDIRERHTQLSALLEGFAIPAVPGPLQRHAETIAALCMGDDLEAMVETIAGTIVNDPWWQGAQRALAAGSPGSARLGFELQRRAAGLTLAETFRLEYVAALHCTAHGDFAEGIRALLIDRDRTPRWDPATLAEADPHWAQAFFIPPPWPQGTHPLADLAGDCR